jgi:putative ABC transport system substrate-binding protein
VTTHRIGMDRRHFLLTSLASALVQPLAVEAHRAGQVYRIGFILTTAPVAEMEGVDPVHDLFRAFVHALRGLGYVEGRNLRLDRRSAEGRFERLDDIVRELVSLNPDVLVAVSSAVTRRGYTVTSIVPIVQVTGFDPVAMGLAQSVARPGRNVTGLTTTPTPEIGAKRLQLLKEGVPTVTRIAFLGMQADWESRWAESVRRAGQALGVALIYAEHQPNAYDDAFALIQGQRANAVYVANNPPNWQHRRLIAEFGARSGLPTTSALRDYAEAGGLMSYGFDVVDNFRRAAGYVDKILKGAKPGELPIEQPTKFELVLNLKTARALGLTIPPSLLMHADQVIE